MGQMVYIVTTGDQTEHKIKGVLFDKTLAHRYAEKIGGKVNGQLTADEKVNTELKKQKTYYELEVTYSLWSNTEEADFHLSIHKCHSMTHASKQPIYKEKKEIRHTCNGKVKQFGFKTLYLYFQVEEELNIHEKEFRNKYYQKSKQAFDAIQAFIKSGGYNEELINQWLVQNYHTMSLKEKLPI